MADPAAVQEYMRARRQYAAEAQGYWNAVAEKRRLRLDKRRNQRAINPDDYVLTQPPVYSGPPKPTEPIEEPPPSLPPKKYVPVVAEFLKAAAEHFGFVPQRPASELEFKRAYVRVAAAAGLTKDQVVRIYAFETGGNGKYDVQAGVDPGRPGSRAISTALGYNQVLAPSTIGILAEKGDRFVRALEEKAARLSGDAREALQRKVAILRRMIAFTRTVPVRWAEHDRLSETPQWWGLHAVNLDIDIGPLLQTQKLLDSVAFARRNGFTRPLSAAELEIMNFTGDGNGFDIVTMPATLRTQVPTSNFFRQPSYERNPIASRNNVVATLIAAIDAAMNRGVNQQGARDMAAAFAQ
jgi:hypothetical protein